MRINAVDSMWLVTQEGEIITTSLVRAAFDMVEHVTQFVFTDYQEAINYAIIVRSERRAAVS